MAQIVRKAGIYVCLDSFWVGNQLIKVGETVREGHPLLKGREQFFKLQDKADYED